MGYFSSDKKKYISTYICRIFYYTVFIFHFKCVSCLKIDSKADLIVLNVSKKKNELYGFRFRAACMISKHRNH